MKIFQQNPMISQRWTEYFKDLLNFCEHDEAGKDGDEKEYR